MMVNKSPQLTPNQEAFCKFIAVGYSPRDAYIRAGYSANSGAPANACRLAAKLSTHIDHYKALVSKGENLDLPEKPVEAASMDLTATNFTTPNIAWLRKEIYETLCRARDEGDFRAANEAASLLFKTMFGADVPKSKGGRPRLSTPTNKGDEDPNNDKPEKSINVSIFNQIADRVDRASRDESAGTIIYTEATPVTSQGHLPDFRPESTTFSFDGSVGDVREGVHVEAGGRGSE